MRLVVRCMTCSWHLDSLLMNIISINQFSNTSITRTTALLTILHTHLTKLFPSGVIVPYLTTACSLVMNVAYVIMRPEPAPVSNAFWLMASTQSLAVPMEPESNVVCVCVRFLVRFWAEWFAKYSNNIAFMLTYNMSEKALENSLARVVFRTRDAVLNDDRLHTR